MAKRLVSASKLTAIGDAIRAKTGSSGLMTLDEMAVSIGRLGGIKIVDVGEVGGDIVLGYYMDELCTIDATVELLVAQANDPTIYRKVKLDPAPDSLVTAFETAAVSRSLEEISWADIALAAASMEKFGVNSKMYESVTAAADAGAYRTTTYNGTTVYATLIGSLCDYAEDGSMLAMSFAVTGGATSSSKPLSSVLGITSSAINTGNTNAGGWAACTLRKTMSEETGSFASLFADDLKAVIKKRHVPFGATYNSTSDAISYCDDFMWLLSYYEVYGKLTSTSGEFYDMDAYPYLAKEGSQYQWFRNCGIAEGSSSKLYGGNNKWLRSCYPRYSTYFGRITMSSSNGIAGANQSTTTNGIIPCFCI